MQPSAISPQVAIVVYPGVQSLDVTGPLEVFAGAQPADRGTGAGAERGYEVRIVSADGAPLRYLERPDR